MRSTCLPERGALRAEQGRWRDLAETQQAHVAAFGLGADELLPQRTHRRSAGGPGPRKVAGKRADTVASHHQSFVLEPGQGTPDRDAGDVELRRELDFRWQRRRGVELALEQLATQHQVGLVVQGNQAFAVHRLAGTGPGP